VGSRAVLDNGHFCHHWRSFSGAGLMVAQIREHWRLRQ